ncbi:MAG TPA: GNAT family N-acetyltransferase [Acidimicrobiales bacterium]|nr:GNAT family N-acetyltransferase [Acidimicrobiales bacterium]
MIEVRAVRRAEHDALAALTVAAYRAVGGGWELGSYADELADVASRTAAADVLVAVDDGEVIGGVTYVPGPGNPYAEDLREGEAGIRMLAVSPAAQGRGAGRALTVACIDRATDAGARGIALHSTQWMTAAHRLYESLGFVRTPARDLTFPDVEILSFVLDLTAPR